MTMKEMVKDLIEIFDEEYEKRRLITPQNTAEKMTAKGYRKQSEWISVADSRKPHNLQKCFIAFVFGDSDMIFYGEARYHAFEGNGLVDRPHFSNEGVEGMTVKYWMPIPRFSEMKGGVKE